MPISIEEFSTPKLTRMQDRWPMSYDSDDRFNEINPMDCAKRYMGDEGREGGWKQPGYNVNHNTTNIERIRVRSDNITLRPY